jgi:hypothetical protein
MPEPLPEHQKTQLIVRSPLSTEGFVSIYFSSPDGRLMSEEEWWNLKQLIELTNRVCVKQQARAQSAYAWVNALDRAALKPVQQPRFQTVL